MKEQDEIFRYYRPKELTSVDSNRYSHYGWEGTGILAFLTLAEAYKKGADTIFEKMKLSKNDFSQLDTLIYPLCFMFRHCTEIFLKYLYIKYSKCTEEELRKFLNKNHRLSNIWSEVKPILSSGKEKVGSNISIGALEYYIKELEKFDPISMRMRYPLNKNLEPQNKTVWLDFYNLHEKLNVFYNKMQQIDYDIDSQVHEQAPQHDIKQFLYKYNSHKNDVHKFIELINNIKSEEKEGLKRKNIFDILTNPNNERTIIYIFLNGLVPNSKILIEVLYYTGINVKERLINLSKNPEDRIAEFITMCLKQMNLDRFSFDKEPENSDINIYSKSVSSIKNSLKIAIDIIESH